MSKKFDKFSELINMDVPRTSLVTPDNSDIPAELTATGGTDELPKPPADGFISTYCNEDNL